jgi:hypothetical protein
VTRPLDGAAESSEPATPDVLWLPGNDVDLELAAALAADDRPRFFRVVRQARWYLPALPPDPDGPRYLTRDLLGHTYLLVFTSVGSLAATVGGMVRGCLVTGYDEMAARWPDPTWRLAVNPGTPIDAWASLDFLAAAAAGTLPIPSLTDSRVPASAAPADEADTDAVLDSVLDTGLDTGLDEFLRQLAGASLLVPTDDGGYRRSGAGVEVFTSARTLRARFPAGVAYVTRTLPELLVDWPAATDLVVDPGSDAPLRIRGDQVAALLLWRPDDPATGFPAAGRT